MTTNTPKKIIWKIPSVFSVFRDYDDDKHLKKKINGCSIFWQKNGRQMTEEGYQVPKQQNYM